MGAGEKRGEDGARARREKGKEAGARKGPHFSNHALGCKDPSAGRARAAGSVAAGAAASPPGGRAAPTGRTHLQRPAPRPHCAPRGSQSARLLLGRQVNSQRPAAAQRAAAPRRKAPSPPPAPRPPRRRAQSPPSPQLRAPAAPRSRTHARRAAVRPGTPCRAGFHRRPQPQLPARPLPGDGVVRPPSLRTRPDSLHQVGSVYLR